MADFITFGDVTFARSAVVLVTRRGSQYTFHLSGVSESVVLNMISGDDTSDLDAFFVDKATLNDWINDPIQA